jgi:hypothetical protein
MIGLEDIKTQAQDRAVNTIGSTIVWDIQAPDKIKEIN